MSKTILTIENQHLARLSPEQAVRFFSQLLWAEANRWNIPVKSLNIPSATDVKDGGVDAEIRDVSTEQGLFNAGLTCYQIKTGNFNLRDTGLIRDIFFVENKPDLRPKIQNCFEQGGTFVIVLFGWDNPETADSQLRKKINQLLPPKYHAANIEIWRQNNLISFLQPYPALCLQINNHSSPFQTHAEWKNEAQMSVTFQLAPPQENVITQLRSRLEWPTGPVHIRLLGEAGIGKTRLVLEATNTEALKPLVIYTTATQFRDSALMSDCLRQDIWAILVLDECNADNKAYLWDKLKFHSPRLKLVTIYNEYEESTSPDTIIVPPLPEQQIRLIIQGYGIPPERAYEWAKECNGSPRVAHLIGANLRENPQDLLKSPDTVMVWERYITGYDPAGSDNVDHRKTVLQFLALFKRFGYGRPVAHEFQAIARLIQTADSRLTESRCRKIIKELRTRRILQGENTLYISPKMLHIKLWLDWWETYGEGFDPITLQQLPPTLVEWFFSMFEYAQGSEKASQMVKQILSDTGWF